MFRIRLVRRTITDILNIDLVTKYIANTLELNGRMTFRRDGLCCNAI